MSIWAFALCNADLRQLELQPAATPGSFSQSVDISSWTNDQHRELKLPKDRQSRPTAARAVRTAALKAFAPRGATRVEGAIKALREQDLKTGRAINHTETEQRLGYVVLVLSLVVFSHLPTLTLSCSGDAI
jgi:hypothetical protein